MSSVQPPDGSSSEGDSLSSGQARPPAHQPSKAAASDAPTQHKLSKFDSAGNEATQPASSVFQSEQPTGQLDPDETSAPSDADRVKRKLRISAQLGIALDPPQRDDAIGTLNNYQILEKIGRGGMGIVMRAFDTVLHRYVALKVMSASLVSSERARERFSREARSAAGINHANVVTIHAIEEHDEIPYLVLEFVEGQTIEQLIRAGHRFDIEEMIRIGSQVAAGLAEAHSQGIVHRDIKPSNILLDSLQRAKISDFGLARLLMDHSDLTSQGDVLGTPSYMSPEQVRGEDADEKSDLFSLGCLFYAMLTGKSPFHATTQIGMATRIQNDDPEPIASSRTDTPQGLNELITTLLKKDASERPDSAEDVSQQLSQMLIEINHQNSGAIELGIGKAPSNTQTNFVPLLILASLAIVAGIGLVAYLRPSSTNPQQTGAQQTEAKSQQAIVQSGNVFELGPKSDQLVVVAADGSGTFKTIGEAIASVGPNSTIQVTSGDYHESLILAEDDRFHGLTIEGVGLPNLSGPPNLSVMEIDGITNLTLSGLKLSGRHDQSALRIRGKCDGLTVQSCEFWSRELEKVQPQALVHIATASGTQQAPIRLINSQIRDARIGLVIGVNRTGAQPTEHMMVENCQLRCIPNKQGIPLVMYGPVREIRFRNNLISMGQPTLSFQFRHPDDAQSLVLQHNTIHAPNVAMHFNQSVAEQNIELTDNLFVGSTSTQSSTPVIHFKSWFKTNGWIALGNVNDSFLSMLEVKRYSAEMLQSLDPSDENYLRPTATAEDDFPGAKQHQSSPQSL